MSEPFDIVRSEASYWWRTNVLAGVILHRTMLLFIAVPILLVIKEYYVASFVVFAGMVPYGLLLERLAERSVSSMIRRHPETARHFAEEGVIAFRNPGADPRFAESGGGLAPRFRAGD